MCIFTYDIYFYYMVEMAETEASLRSVASQTFRIYISASFRPWRTARHGLCGFDYLTLFTDIKKTPKRMPFLYGGDEGD